MRVAMRKAINVDKPLDTSKLSPWQEVVVGAAKGYRSRERFQQRLERQLEKEHKLRISREESLKEDVLTFVYGELVEGRTMKAKGLVARKIQLTIPRSYEKELREIVKHREFVSFEMHIEEVDPDILRSFPTVKILLTVVERR